MRSTFTDELRFITRRLRRNVIFATSVAATLALGIGALSAVFSAVYGVLLRRLPYHDAGRLVTLWVDLRARGRADPEWLSFPDFADWRDHARSLSGTAAYTGWSATVPGDGTNEPERVPGASVSWNYFDVLGVGPSLGRTFQQTEDVPNAERVVVLGDGVWRRRLGADPSIVGRALTLNDEPWTVIGVMPASFRSPMPGVEIWRPLRQTRASDPCGRGCISLQAVARLRPGVTLPAAREDLTRVLERAAETDADVAPGSRAWPIPLRDQLVGEVRSPLLVLAGAVALVLLLVCANLANLQLVRGLKRTGELAVRLALGADRARLRRELLGESLVLALLGGVGGIVIASVGTGVLRSIMPPRVVSVTTIGLDWRVVAFTAVASVVTGALFGTAPAWRLADVELGRVLRETSRSGSRRDVRFRNALVVAQFALALVLVNAAVLLTRSFVNLSRTDLGFEPARVVAVNLQLPRGRFATPAESQQFFQSLVERLRALPGVASAAATSIAPLDNGDMTFSFLREGEAPQRGSTPNLWTRRITPDYFATMGMVLRAGRGITSEDRAGTPQVAVINEAAARTYWPGTSPLDKTITLQGPSGDAPTRIVGIVASARHDGPRQTVKPEVFVPAAQVPARAMTVVVRSRREPAALVGSIRQAVRDAEPSLAVPTPRPFAERVADAVALPRLFMRVLAGFGVAALALASIGIYGLVRYSVETRAREFGIRMAIGAAPAGILALVSREVAVLAALGVVLGVGGALAAGRLLGSLVVGLSSTDVTTTAVTTLTLVAVAAVATLVPARHAMRTDPSVALRDP